MYNFYIWMEKFSNHEIEKVNKTFKKWGFKSSLPPNKILTYVLEYLGKHPKAKILDYGAGKFPTVSEYLKSSGYDVTSHEIGSNKTKIHDTKALHKKYDVIFASNVLNVQIDEDMLKKTLKEIKHCLKGDGCFIASYPDTPRNLKISNDEFMEVVKKIFPKATFDKYHAKGLMVFVGF